jgi:hypothetical protein
MRYREDSSGPAVASVDESMVSGTAVYALLAGLLLCVAGVRSRKYWLASMGAVLVVSSGAYLGWRLFGSS